MSDKDNRSRETPEDSHIIKDENSDLDCPAALPGFRKIKINLSDILKLAYNSMIT